MGNASPEACRFSRLETARSVQATSLSRPTRLFVHSRARRRLRANTSRRIKRSSGWYHPCRYRLQRFRTAAAGCACTPNAKRPTRQQWRKQLLRIFGYELIRMNGLIKIMRSAVSKNFAVFFLRRQPRDFQKVALVARRRWHFREFLAIFLVAQLPQRGILVHKISLAYCQRCRQSVESRALTCPCKQSNLGAWSLLSWHFKHTYL